MVRCNNCFHTFSDEYEVCPSCGYYAGKEESPVYRLPHGTLVNNRYVVGELLGQGGFGIVYKAWDTTLETVVAIKEFYPASMVNRVPGTREVIVVTKKNRKIYDNNYKHFLAEARNVARFSGNSNIVDVFNYFEENGTAYFVMEYMQGVSLHKYIKQNGGKLSVEESVNIISEMCNIMTLVHQKGIIHRDIAPDNIYICDNGIRKLYDFGVALFIDDDSEVEVAIKPGFAPPEQYNNFDKQGTYTDVYALGATMYRMVTGQMPEESTNRKIVDNTLPPHVIDPSIPVNISNAIMRAMAIDEHLRFANMQEFKKALIGQIVVVDPETEKKRRKRRRIISIVAAMLVLCVCGGVFLHRWQLQKEAETLPKATIEVWYIEDEYGTKKQAAFEAIVKEFTGSYEEVTVNVTGVPADEYEKKLKDALSSGNGPHIFENYGIDGITITNTDDAKSVISSEKSSLILDDSILEYASKTGRVPLGFVMPIVYVNKGKETVNTLDEAKSKLNISDIRKETSKDDFLAKDVNYYVGTNSDYKTVQSKLAGLYKMFPMDDASECQYAMEFSIGNCDKNQKKCVIRFLQFCYSDNAQDSLFIQNDTGSLPMNKEVLAVFEKYNQEYKGFFNNIGECTFE